MTLRPPPSAAQAPEALLTAGIPRIARRPVEKPVRSAKRPPRRTSFTVDPRDPLFESLREELGL